MALTQHASQSSSFHTPRMPRFKDNRCSLRLWLELLGKHQTHLLDTMRGSVFCCGVGWLLSASEWTRMVHIARIAVRSNVYVVDGAYKDVSHI